ncbi:major facilitator superfamily domain-containing protein [Mortierella sp. GBAus27b]|nr:hypothetical protein BGX31_003171 [Mortierella sp. GBA43]KAI8356051.1 major facilitator superfamily domain-containing protein [Mortierella sp. GBAus27b]
MDRSLHDITDPTPAEYKDSKGEASRYLEEDDDDMDAESKDEVDIEASEPGSFDHHSAEVKKLRWKIDKRLVPMLSLLYLCSFLDRVNIGNAKVANMEEHLHMNPGDYNLALSIFYVGYVLGEVPANMILKKLGPRLWIPLVMVAWGTVSMCMAAVTNGAGLVATRFFLGLAESGFAPGPAYMISLWYRRSEQALRIGVFFSAATVAGAFGGVLAYGITRLHSALGLHAWQWIFIIEGIPTILCALLAWVVLPDFPETSTFLTPAEKALCIQRLEADAGPATDREFSWKQFWAAFQDWKVYGHMAMGFLHSVAFASLGLFVPSITMGFGFDRVVTQIMTAPVYALACAFTISMTISSDRLQERGYHTALAAMMGCLGYVLLILTREASVAARYISLIITTCGVYSFVPLMLSWPCSNIGGHTKKGVAIAAIISFAQIGGVVGGQIYRDEDAPLYVRGHTICAILLAITTAVVLGLKTMIRRENNRRASLSPDQRELERIASDMTDRHPDFKYYE